MRWLYPLLIVELTVLLPACSPSSQSLPSAEQAELTPVDLERGARLQGQVSFQGEPPPARPIRMGSEAACAAVHPVPILAKTILTDSNGGLRNVFVTVWEGLEGKEFAVPSQPVRLDQQGCLYRPHVLGVQTGQALTISNSDPVSHNVHPVPRINFEWNRTQRPGADELELVYQEPEFMITVKCNLHPWMRAYLNVVSHPFFEVTGSEGSYEIRGLPAGRYLIVAVHESLGRQEASVDVEAGRSHRLDFTFLAD